MDEPLVSVVIPAYRCAGTVCRAVDSALAQNVPLEVIVLSDGPQEALDRVMTRYAGVPEVIYVGNDRNLGAAQTRNRGVAMARGVYTAFLDADDYWAEGKLRRQLAAMERSGAVLCATARELMTPDGTSTGRILPVAERVTYRDLLKHNSIACSSVLMRTEVAREFPMHHEDSHEDYILWLQVLQKYGFACGVNEPLLKYTLSATGKSGSKWKSARMTFRVYRYMGFGWCQSVACFCSYAWHGLKKYGYLGRGEKHET